MKFPRREKRGRNSEVIGARQQSKFKLQITQNQISLGFSGQQIVFTKNMEKVCPLHIRKYFFSEAIP